MLEKLGLEKLVKVRNEEHELSSRRLQVLGEIEIDGELYYDLFDLDEWQPLEWHRAYDFQIIKDSLEINFAVATYELETLEYEEIYPIDPMLSYLEEPKFIAEQQGEPKIIRPWLIEKVSHNIRFVKTYKHDDFFVLIRNPEETEIQDEVYLGHTAVEENLYVDDLSDIDLFDSAELISVSKIFGENQVFFFNANDIQPRDYTLIGKDVYAVKTGDVDSYLILRKI